MKIGFATDEKIMTASIKYDVTPLAAESRQAYIFAQGSCHVSRNSEVGLRLTEIGHSL